MAAGPLVARLAGARVHAGAGEPLEVRVEVGVGADGATAVERERRGGEGREERSLHLKRSFGGLGGVLGTGLGELVS